MCVCVKICIYFSVQLLKCYAYEEFFFFCCEDYITNVMYEIMITIGIPV